MPFLMTTDVLDAEDVLAARRTRIETVLHDAAVPGLRNDPVRPDAAPGKMVVDERREFAGGSLRAMQGHEMLPSGVKPAKGYHGDLVIRGWPQLQPSTIDADA